MKKSCTVDGSYTVEAALIFPIVFFIILSIVLFALYLHDVCKIQVSVNRTLYKFTGVMRQEDAEAMEEYLRRQLIEDLFISKITYVEAKAEDNKASLSVRGQMDLPLLYAKEIRIKETSSLHNPSDSIRKAEVILDTASKIKGADALKERIKSILE